MTTNARQSIDVAALEGWIDINVPTIRTPLTIKQVRQTTPHVTATYELSNRWLLTKGDPCPCTLTFKGLQFSHGQSNPTYLLRAQDGQQYVLRKKPPGTPASSSGHQIEREFLVINALQSTKVPVPKTFGICRDASVLDTPFYIMEFLDGRIFEEPWLPGLPIAERSLMYETWQEAVSTLNKLHSIDLSVIGLQRWKKDTAFYNRQISVLGRVSTVQAQTRSTTNGQSVGQMPFFDQLVEFFLQAKCQPRERKALVHGDFKLDNLVFHKTEPRVIGIIDWELATEGHPLADLANLLSPMLNSAGEMSWLAEQTLTTELAQVREMFRPEITQGLPSLSRCLDWYSQASGWRVLENEFIWAAAFSSFRTAIIMQGIAARLATKRASSASARPLAQQTLPYAFMAQARVQRIKDTISVTSKV